MDSSTDSTLSEVIQPLTENASPQKNKIESDGDVEGAELATKNLKVYDDSAELKALNTSPSKEKHVKKTFVLNQQNEIFQTPGRSQEGDPCKKSPQLQPIQSPCKSPISRVPLPRVVSGSLNIMKKRRLEPTSPSFSQDPNSPPQNLRITPSKSRSFSSPVYPGSAMRTPSIQDKPIPVLSPPSPTSSSRSTSSTFVSPYSLFRTPKSDRNSLENLQPLPGSASSSSSEDSHPPSPSISPAVDLPNEGPYPLPLCGDENKVTKSTIIPTESKHISIPQQQFKSLHRFSPLASKSKDSKITDLSNIDLELDRELMRWRKLTDTARQAQKYTSANEDEKLKDLSEKWLDVAQKGAFFLFNAARERIDRMGGMEEYIRRKKEDEESRMQSGFEDSNFDVDKLSPEERERYEILKSEYEDEMQKNQEKDDEDEEDEKEFTMKYMLKSLNLDYNLIFPEGYDTDFEI